jgi:SAM-dependent methyltransferase
MRKVVAEHGLAEGKVVIDVGSYNYNGSYRAMIEADGSRYVGADIMPGPNVDVIVGTPEWNALEGVDAVISGQTLEHVEDVPSLMAQMFRILKDGGLLCVITPSAGPAHDAPKWYRNYSEESLRSYVEAVGFKVLSCVVNPAGDFRDCCCVAKKPEPRAAVKSVRMFAGGTREDI